MPKIIAKAIADAISESSNEAEIRSAIVLGVQMAESAGYEPGSENLFAELRDELQALAGRATDERTGDLLNRAAEIVCEIADQ